MSNNTDPKLIQVNPWSIRSGSRAIWVLNGQTGLSGLTITLEEDGDTLLTGPVADQAALHGLLKKVRDLGMPLVSVNRVQINETHPYHSQAEEK